MAGQQALSVVADTAQEAAERAEKVVLEGQRYRVTGKAKESSMSRVWIVPVEPKEAQK